jgi:hypothetical protein
MKRTTNMCSTASDICCSYPRRRGLHPRATRKHYRKFVTKGVQCCNAVALTFVLSKLVKNRANLGITCPGGFVDEPMADPRINVLLMPVHRFPYSVKT